MMRKLMLIVISCLLLPINLIHAQETWTDYATVTVNDYHFTFSYPEGWVNAGTGGVFLAENSADAEAEAAGEVPKGIVLSLQGVALTNLELDNTATADDALAFLTEAFEIEIEEQFDLPIMSYRGIVVRGTFFTGRHNLFIVWIQDNSAMLLKLSAANEQTILDHAGDFGFIVASAAPITETPLTELLQDGAQNFSMPYPADWIWLQNTDTTGLFELQADADNPTNPEPYAGHSIYVMPATYDEVGVKPDIALGDLAARAADQFDIADPVLHEHLVLGDEYGIGLSGVSPTWGYLDLLVIPRAENVLTILVSSPSLEAAEAFKPTRLAIWQAMIPLNPDPQ